MELSKVVLKNHRTRAELKRSSSTKNYEAEVETECPFLLIFRWQVQFSLHCFCKQ